MCDTKSTPFSEEVVKMIINNFEPTFSLKFTKLEEIFCDYDGHRLIIDLQLHNIQIELINEYGNKNKLFNEGKILRYKKSNVDDFILMQLGDFKKITWEVGMQFLLGPTPDLLNDYWYNFLHIEVLSNDTILLDKRTLKESECRIILKCSVQNFRNAFIDLLEDLEACYNLS